MFNLTSDPYEQHNLDMNDYPEVVTYIQNKLLEIRQKRPTQQKFWMQLSVDKAWPKTFVGEGNGNQLTDKFIDDSVDGYRDGFSNDDTDTINNSRKGNTICEVGCKFVHPWYSDSYDAWSDDRLIDGHHAANIKCKMILYKLLGLSVIIILISVVVLRWGWGWRN